MAKKPSVVMRDFFANTPAIEVIPLDSLAAIYEKSFELGAMTYDDANGWPISAHRLAQLLASEVLLAAEAISNNDAMLAMIHGYKIGEYRQRISTLMAVQNSLDHQKKALKPRKAGGDATGAIQQEEALETTDNIERTWNELKTTPEHNRAAIIAERTGLAVQTVRRHIRTIKKRTSAKQT